MAAWVAPEMAEEEEEALQDHTATVALAGMPAAMPHLALAAAEAGTAEELTVQTLQSLALLNLPETEEPVETAQ